MKSRLVRQMERLARAAGLSHWGHSVKGEAIPGAFVLLNWVIEFRPPALVESETLHLFQMAMAMSGSRSRVGTAVNLGCMLDRFLLVEQGRQFLGM